jgi:hypothetical protein
MNIRITSVKQAARSSLSASAAICVFLSTFFSAGAFGEDQKTQDAKVSSNFSATHVLGLRNTHPNTSGSLEVQNGSLRFESKKQAVELVHIDSIEAVHLSQQDKQVGGVPMTIGKAAAPFGGGRVVSLFSHKKYDDIAVIYRDDDGGVHGAIFQLSAGQGTKLRDELVNNGARVGAQQNPATGQSPEVSDAKN